jgi:predicted nucleic acid-binding protein
VITYVDTSTFVKLLIDEAGTERARTIWTAARSPTSVVLVRVEARSALAAARRDRRITPHELDRALRALDRLADELTTVAVSGLLVERASEFVDQFGLRGYDAVHLAAADFVGADVLTSTDRSLCGAATAYGFHVANPLEP